ncbi:uncharacterized protein (UPF0335 family) [Methylosinus sp. sav-2]|uniref:DUF2312 domain-containing protein n=1 Tax=Methylosinus sp. sav-2 TaxID=2485168 RepID=UPI00047A1F07|nr:DUF2312 domain-containing protein [Methylosinus sp. sav-2]TDX65170.1 uncharacterized protein (UPF0335 family) [Methylosinus sp. sav-2]
MPALISVDGVRLRAFILRIERLAEEKDAISADIKDVYGEVKSVGFDPKIVRKIVALRRVDRTKREEEAEILDLYLSALGDFMDTPLGEAARRDDE